MPHQRLAEGLLLPELRLVKTVAARGAGLVELYVEKTSAMEVCPRCATPSWATYERRWARIKDAPARAKRFTLCIRKRRFWCRACGRPFTEPVAGIRKGSRCTERYRKEVLWACERFGDLKSSQEPPSNGSSGNGSPQNGRRRQGTLVLRQSSENPKPRWLAE